MSRALLAGDTDYSFQSLDEMENDLKDWEKGLSDVIQLLEKHSESLKRTNYWNKINPDIQMAFEKSLAFFQASNEEISSILCEIGTEIETHHVKRLEKIGKTAFKLNRRIRSCWHDESWEISKEYGNQNFLRVESFYRESSDMFADMYDLEHLSNRLNDFVGKKRSLAEEKKMEIPSATNNGKVFISYSHDNKEHKEWVRKLATRLRSDGIDVILDRWELVPGDQLPSFMEKSVNESGCVLVICTPNYKVKSNKRQGGVGYEGDIMTSEILSDKNHRKFIPILKGKSREESIPTWLVGKFCIDLSGEPYSQEEYQDLLETLLGTREKAPPLGTPPHK